MVNLPSIHEVKTLAKLLDLKEAMEEERDDFKDVLLSLDTCETVQMGTVDLPIRVEHREPLRVLISRWSKEADVRRMEVTDKIERLEKQL